MYVYYISGQGRVQNFCLRGRLNLFNEGRNNFIRVNIITERVKENFIETYYIEFHQGYFEEWAYAPLSYIIRDICPVCPYAGNASVSGL